MEDSTRSIFRYISKVRHFDTSKQSMLYPTLEDAPKTINTSTYSSDVYFDFQPKRCFSAIVMQQPHGIYGCFLIPSFLRKWVLPRTPLSLLVYYVRAHRVRPRARLFLSPAASLAVSVQVGADGRVHATVLYPSMKEIWPEMYITKNVRVVEVWYVLLDYRFCPNVHGPLWC